MHFFSFSKLAEDGTTCMKVNMTHLAHSDYSLAAIYAGRQQRNMRKISWLFHFSIMISSLAEKEIPSKLSLSN